MNALSLRKEFAKRKNPAKVKILSGFFKTGKGEYAEGDRFYGVTVPEIRRIAKRYSALPLVEIKRLLEIGWHEERLCALLLLVERFKKGNPEERKKIVDFYLAHTKYINNWDLVDVTAHHIVGAYLWEKPRTILKKLARSKNLWERRIAIVATFSFIRAGQYGDTLNIAKLLLRDEHDLIHKAVGWMLREVGKRCGRMILEKFLKPRYQKMPRTMLRYAIERFPESVRRRYLVTKKSY
ncbi:MAG: DNA alkylation repair protein [bacterium]|nr:DNA alkylation repair protein [bacterium]